MADLYELHPAEIVYEVERSLLALCLLVGEANGEEPVPGLDSLLALVHAHTKKALRKMDEQFA